MTRTDGLVAVPAVDVASAARLQTLLAVAAVVAVALVARALAAAVIVFPKPEDTAYYVGVARNLVEGRGLVSDALWSYQTPPLILPRPAFEVWLPLPTILAAIPMAILGPTFASAQVSSVVMGALVPVLAWRVAADAAAERGLPPGRAAVLAAGAGLTTAVYLPLVLHSALPDSTIPFAILVLTACLLMARIAARPRAARANDVRLLGLGVVLGLAALTRNEAVWLALTWVVVASSAIGTSRRVRLRLVAIPAIVAFAVFAPWAIRDWIAFGSPLPGQALTNALSLTGRDIFAWADPPTLQRYLAAGWATLIELRVTGVLHNLLNVLVLLGIPISVIGLAAMPWFGTGRALRPLVIFSLLTFTITSLLFPVATTWGTFLHAAGAIHVLLVVACLLALDRAIVAIGRRRAWTNPVAWLGPALTVFGAAVFTVAVLPSFGASSRETQQLYASLGTAMDRAGEPLVAAGPVITNFPIWLSETAGIRALALPDEPPTSVVALARSFPGARLVVVIGTDGRYPAAIDAREPGSECFQEVSLRRDPGVPGPFADARVFRLVCP
ncbi:MAG TPA: hypothetical protein VGC90_04035 [Candidatus Limnocylindrales bacterium]